MNADFQIAEQALSYIDPTERETWFQAAAALKSRFGDAGFPMWDGWSQGADNYNSRDAADVWRSIKSGGGINFGTLIHKAKEGGYTPATPAKRPTTEEIKARELERERREAEERKATEQRQAQAKARAGEILSGRPHAKEHPYLKAKGVRSYKIFHLKNGDLGIPMRDDKGVIWSVQSITAEGKKLFLKDGRAKGLYFSIGQPQGKIVIAEGYATGASIHEATGYAVAVAFSAGNLAKVAETLKSKYPSADLIIAGDVGNGSTEANKAANSVGGRVAFPVLSNGKDFNDLHQESGLSAVKQQIDAAKLPDIAIAPSDPAPAIDATAGTQAANDDDIRQPQAPEPLPSLPNVMPFSYDTLPSALRDFVADIADRMQCPPDFAAVSSVVMMGAAIGRRVGVRPKREDDWTVVPNLWGMVVGKSGIMKSPAMSSALAPLRAKQAQSFEDHAAAMEAYEVAGEISNIQYEEAQKNARKLVKQNNKSGAENELAQARANFDKPPTPERYIVNDTTVEALAEVLEENQNGVLVDRDELAGWLKTLDKEGQQGSRAFYLTAADGDKPITTDRIARGRNRNIKGATVSIIGGIQPGVLASYVRDTQKGGAGDDGLLQRFGMMVYPDVTKDWVNVDRKPNTAARNAVNALVDRICSLDAAQIGAEIDPYHAIPFLRFSEKAQGIFDGWQQELENRIRGDDEHPAIVSHLSKYRKLVPALALINHLCEGGTGPITDTALARALFMSEYLESHAKRVYSYASRPDIDAARTLIGKIKSGKLKSTFKAQDVYRSGWAGLNTSEETRAALALLTDYGYLTQIYEDRDDDKAGRKPKPTFEAHHSIRPKS